MSPEEVRQLVREGVETHLLRHTDRIERWVKIGGAVLGGVNLLAVVVGLLYIFLVLPGQAANQAVSSMGSAADTVTSKLIESMRVVGRAEVLEEHLLATSRRMDRLDPRIATIQDDVEQAAVSLAFVRDSDEVTLGQTIQTLEAFAETHQDLAAVIEALDLVQTSISRLNNRMDFRDASARVIAEVRVFEGNFITLSPNAQGEATCTVPAGWILVGGGFRAEDNIGCRVLHNRADDDAAATWSVVARNVSSGPIRVRAEALGIKLVLR